MHQLNNCCILLIPETNERSENYNMNCGASFGLSMLMRTHAVLLGFSKSTSLWLFIELIQNLHIPHTHHKTYSSAQFSFQTIYRSLRPFSPLLVVLRPNKC